MKNLFLLFFIMSFCFFTCCRDSYPPLEDNQDLHALIRDWATRYNPLPQTPIALYYLEPADAFDVEQYVVVMEIGNRHLGRVFGYNDDWNFWADFGDSYEDYDLEGVVPDEIMAFCSQIVLPQPEVEGDDFSEEDEASDFGDDGSDDASFYCGKASEEW